MSAGRVRVLVWRIAYLIPVGQVCRVQDEGMESLHKQACRFTYKYTCVIDSRREMIAWLAYLLFSFFRFLFLCVLPAFLTTTTSPPLPSTFNMMSLL